MSNKNRKNTKAWYFFEILRYFQLIDCKDDYSYRGNFILCNQLCKRRMEVDLSDFLRQSYLEDIKYYKSLMDKSLLMSVLRSFQCPNYFLPTMITAYQLLSLDLSLSPVTFYHIRKQDLCAIYYDLRGYILNML